MNYKCIIIVIIGIVYATIGIGLAMIDKNYIIISHIDKNNTLKSPKELNPYSMAERKDQSFKKFKYERD